jgi:molybdenum cofactor cytidylyltransferase
VGTVTVELCDALKIHDGELVAIVGGGGKTSALYRLGAELAARGVPVLLSGTARFTPPERGEAPNLAIVEDADALRRAVDDGRSPLTVATGWGSKGRLLPLEPAWLDRLHHERPDLVIVVEADGSAMRPFKAPGEHEPVIPADATLVVACVGLDAVGRPLDETHVHRPERVATLTSASLGDTVTEAMVCAVLVHPDGGRKGVPAGARWAAVLNKADTAAREAGGRRIVERLRAMDETAILARLKQTPPVLSDSTGGSV